MKVTPDSGRQRLVARVGLPLLLLGIVVVLAGCASDSDESDESGIDVTDISIFQDSVVGDGEVETSGDAEVAPVEVDAEGLEDNELEDNELEEDELEALIASRYEAYWDAFDSARRSPSAKPSADHPALLELAAGDQLDQSYDQVEALFEIGEAMRESGSPSIDGTDSSSEHRVRVELVDEALATIVACTVADDERYNVETDEAVEQNVLSVESRSTMVISDGEWKIIRAEATSIEQGVTGCWLEGDDVYPY